MGLISMRLKWMSRADFAPRFPRHRIAVSGILAWMICAGLAFGDDGASAPITLAQGPGAAVQSKSKAKATAPQAAKTQDANLLSTLQEALERNTREIKALREQHAQELEALKKQTELQKKQIEELEKKALAQAEQLKNQGGAPKDEKDQEIERLRHRDDLQQKQIELLQKQAELIAEQLENQAPTVEKLQTEAATLETRTQQGAQRDQEIANAIDSIEERFDAEQRKPPELPPTLKQLFLPSQTNTSPFTIYNSLTTRYNIFNNRKGAGGIEFQEYTPFLLVQLNKRFLLSAETSFTPGGVALGQAQLDMFITDWLTADLGYFLLPVGFWNERLDPNWINKLPDIPLVMRQVIPDGLVSTGFQLRGAKYIAGSPVKLEYSAAMTNGLATPGMGQLADWADLGSVLGTSGNVNSALAYTGRLGLWLPSRGINFGVSEFVNAPYTHQAGAVMSVWQPYFNYHYGNWDFRFEYGNMFEKTQSFIGNNIRRDGLYTQIAYRDYKSMNKYLQRLEGVFRFSEVRFHGIDETKLDLTTFDPLMNAPVNRNQYTIGINYYFYPSTILKFAYEINQEQTMSLKDNVFMAQFATNF